MPDNESVFTKYINDEGIYFERGYVARVKLKHVHQKNSDGQNLHDFELRKLCIYGAENHIIETTALNHVSSQFCIEVDGNIQARGHISWCLILNKETLSKVYQEFTLLGQNAAKYTLHSDEYYLICRDTIYGPRQRRISENDE